MEDQTDDVRVVVRCCFVVCLSLTLVENLESVVLQRCCGALRRSEKPNEIKICPGNTTLSSLKRTIRRGAQVKKSNVQTELHGRAYPLNYSVELPRSHKYPIRGYKLQRLGCLHRTNRTVIVSTDERACCLNCCRSDDTRACSETRAIEQ